MRGRETAAFILSGHRLSEIRFTFGCGRSEPDSVSARKMHKFLQVFGAHVEVL